METLLNTCISIMNKKTNFYIRNAAAFHNYKFLFQNKSVEIAQDTFCRVPQMFKRFSSNKARMLS